MKYCPSCRLKYADETLQFCLQDGTGLLDYSETAAPTQHWSEKETVVRQKPVTADWQPPRITQNAATAPTGKKSGTFLTIALTALAMSVVFGGLIIGWLVLKEDQPEKISSSNLKTPAQTSTPMPTKTVEQTQTNNPVWEIDYSASLNGERITYYPGTTVEQCQTDCAKISNCAAFTLIRAGAYNPQDPPMCYLMSKVTSPSKHSCCISGIKK